MTTQEKKRWLNRANDTQKLIDDYKQEYRKALDRAQSITAKLSGNGGGGERDPHKFDMVAEYSTKLEKAIAAENLVKAEILDAIERLQDPVQKRVLVLHYLSGYSWQKVAKRMHYSERGVLYIHGKALVAIDIPEVCSSLQYLP